MKRALTHLIRWLSPQHGGSLTDSEATAALYQALTRTWR